MAQLKKYLVAAPKQLLQPQEVLSMGREVRNFTRFMEGLTTRPRASRITEERLTKHIRFLENKCEEEDLIRDSIMSSHANDLSPRSHRYDEYTLRSFSSNFNPRNKRR